MKYLIVITAIIFLYCTSCNNSKQKVNDEDLFYYTSSLHKYGFNQDTVALQKVQKHDTLDDQIAIDYFELDKKRHTIRMYSNYSHVSCGSHISYVLDSIGVIYSKGTTWRGYQRLNCTNDSINRIITVALEVILSNPKFLHLSQPPVEKSVAFISQKN